MGLSSKQVSIDSLDWSQNLPPELPEPSTGKRQPPQNQERSEPLKCPRCDSMNTKFCYYNNYNKSQPRHFCKSCKRHWTNGGTLRNVPVGGARKNKRLKMSKTVARDSPAATVADRVNTHMVIHAHQPKQSLHLALGDRKNSIKSSSSSEEKCSSGLFFGSNLCLPLNHEIPIIPFSSSSSCDTDHSSMFSCFQSPHVYNYYSAGETAQDSVVTTVVPTISPIAQHQSWPVANAMDTTSCWNWDDIDNFVSTPDLNVQWDVCELKP